MFSKTTEVQNEEEEVKKRMTMAGAKTFDDKMVRASLTPLSDIKQDCIYWLEQYFHNNGDFIPNSDNEIRVNMQVEDLYDEYIRTKDEDEWDPKVVSYETFSNLWRTLSPNCLTRPYVDIPGKCGTCYEIDRQRKCFESKDVQRLLADAHLLHRGGMFMLERKE